MVPPYDIHHGSSSVQSTTSRERCAMDSDAASSSSFASGSNMSETYSYTDTSTGSNIGSTLTSTSKTSNNSEVHQFSEPPNLTISNDDSRSNSCSQVYANFSGNDEDSINSPSPQVSLSTTPMTSDASEEEEEGEEDSEEYDGVSSCSEDQSIFSDSISEHSIGRSKLDLALPADTLYSDVNVFLTEGKMQQTVEMMKRKQGRKSEPAIMKCSRDDNIDAVKKLVSSQGQDVNETDANDRTALHEAASLGRVKVAKLLIDLGANVDSCSAAGKAPLHEACINGRYEVLQLLITEVLDLDMVDSSGLSAAHYCALNGEEKCLSLLCAQGCDICLEDKQGRTGVHLACVRGYANIIDCLTQRGMELDAVDYTGKTPAHYAARHGSLECLEVLATNNVDLNAGDNEGSQPIHEAAANNQLKCVQFLLKKGAKRSAVDKKGQTPVHKAAHHGALKCLHWLLDKDKTPDRMDKLGWSGLHHAASCGRAKCFHCLLQHGADKSVRSVSGDTPMDVARLNGRPVAISKAVENQVLCEQCEERRLKLLKEEGRAKPSFVLAKMQENKKTLFVHKPSTNSSRSISSYSGPKRSTSRSSKTPSTSLEPPQMQRMLATKYYGKH